MGTTPERNDLSKLLPVVSSAESKVVQCVNSDTSTAFLSPFAGARLTGLTVLRYPGHDVIYTN